MFKVDQDLRFYMKNKKSMPGISIRCRYRSRRTKTTGVIIGHSSNRWSFPVYRVLWTSEKRQWTSWHAPKNLIFLVKAGSRRI